MYITPNDPLAFAFLKHRDGKRAAVRLVNTQTQEHVEFQIDAQQLTKICREFIADGRADRGDLQADPQQAMRPLDALAERFEQTRIHTLTTALRAALEVIGKWLARVETINGQPYINIEDADGARKLYATLRRAYSGETSNEAK